MPLAELTALLTADNRQFIKSLNEAVKVAKKSGGEVESAWKKIGGMAGGQLLGALSAGAVIGFTKSLVDMGGELSDSSEKLNLTIESLQSLGYAFGQSGARQEDFEKGVVKLNQSIDDALDGNQKMEESFRRLGISMKDLEDKSPQEILYMLADGMKNASNSTEALAAVMDILGKGGAKMASGLKQGAEGLQELEKQAMALSSVDAGELDAIGDALARLYQNAKTLSALSLLGKAPQWLQNINPLVKGISSARNLYGIAFGEEQKGMRGHRGTDASSVEDITEQETSPDKAMGNPRGRKWNKEEEEHADDMLNSEKEQADFIEGDLKRRQEMYNEIQKINEDTWYTERDMARIGMDSHELIVDLEKERAHWLAEAVRYENDIFGIHNKDAALARQRAAEIAKQIAEVPREIEDQKFTNSPRGRKMTPEEDAQATLADKFGAFKNFKTGPFNSSGGGLTTGGLTSGGLDSGGLGDAYHKVKSGDAARARQAAKDAKKNKDPVADATAQNTAALAEAWGAKGVRP